MKRLFLCGIAVAWVAGFVGLAVSQTNGSDGIRKQITELRRQFDELKKQKDALQAAESKLLKALAEQERILQQQDQERQLAAAAKEAERKRVDAAKEAERLRAQFEEGAKRDPIEKPKQYAKVEMRGKLFHSIHAPTHATLHYLTVGDGHWLLTFDRPKNKDDQDMSQEIKKFIGAHVIITGKLALSQTVITKRSPGSAPINPRTLYDQMNPLIDEVGATRNIQIIRDQQLEVRPAIIVETIRYVPKE